MARRYVDCRTLYDGTGRGTIDDARIVIEDGRVTEVGPTDEVPEPEDAAREAHFQSITDAHEAGVHIAAGTDFIGPELIPHGENAMELELYVEEVGMEPLEALHTATGATAATIVDDDVGTLTDGDRADVVVLSDDPREDVSAVRESVAAVYKGGQAVP